MACNWRVIAFAAITISFFVFPAAAKAKHYPCWIIKTAIETFGETAAVAWAKERGMSEEEIAREKKRCAKT
jgi:hypothetical protein